MEPFETDELVKILREEAAFNHRAGDAVAAKALRQAADELEAAVVRNDLVDGLFAMMVWVVVVTAFAVLVLVTTGVFDGG